MFERLKNWWSSEDECQCEDMFPSEYEDSGFMFLLDEEYDAIYWCEYDAVYVRLQSKTTWWVCTVCGERHVINSSEMLSGSRNIKIKEEMDDDELEEFREEVHRGTFVNGLPEHRAIKWD